MIRASTEPVTTPASPFIMFVSSTVSKEVPIGRKPSCWPFKAFVCDLSRTWNWVSCQAKQALAYGAEGRGGA